MSALVTLGTVALGQHFDINWSTIDNGGGVSTGGAYELSGTLAQPDATAMSGGGYALVGGFWGRGTAITPPPPLEIVCVNQVVTVSWPRSASGFVLEHALTLGGSPSPWSLVSTTLQTNATRITATVPVGDDAEFYRLRR